MPFTLQDLRFVNTFEQCLVGKHCYRNQGKGQSHALPDSVNSNRRGSSGNTAFEVVLLDDFTLLRVHTVRQRLSLSPKMVMVMSSSAGHCSIVWSSL